MEPHKKIGKRETDNKLIRIHLRCKRWTLLENDVKHMHDKYNFFDSYYNKV